MTNPLPVHENLPMFHPWIGPHYGPESRFGGRLLVLGESHYGRPGEDDEPTFTQDVVRYYSAEHRHPYFTRIAKVLRGDRGWIDDEERAAISRILRAGLGRHEADREEIEKALEVAGQLELYNLSSYIRGFGLVASLAPMLGFLGTVAGMIGAFNAIAAAGTSNPSLVANGISAALLSTASGLVIGIPALALYHFFRGRVDRFVQEMEEVALELVEDLMQRQRINELRRQADAV